MKCIVKLIWDDNEKFWHSESMDERFGLTLESGSLDVLIERVKMGVPEMFELIGYSGVIDLSFEIELNTILQGSNRTWPEISAAALGAARI